MVQQEVQSMFAGYQIALRDDLVEPLRALDAKSAKGIDLESLESGLANLQGNFESELDKSPDFWESFSGKAEFFSKLEEEVDYFWREAGSGIEKQYQELDTKLSDLQTKRSILEEQQKLLRGEEDRLAERLNQIEFPLGKLPISLNEAVAIFPLILVIGFVQMAALLIETTRLRGAYHQLSRQKDPNRAVLTDEQVALIAPLFVDPSDRIQSLAIRSFILLVPLLIIVVSGGLIIYSWVIPEIDYKTVEFNLWLYSSLYLMGISIYIYSFRRVMLNTRRYPHFDNALSN